jgi:hypothetical protein
MVKMGNTWRGVEKSTMAGETDQGLTQPRVDNLSWTDFLYSSNSIVTKISWAVFTI